MKNSKKLLWIISGVILAIALIISTSFRASASSLLSSLTNNTTIIGNGKIVTKSIAVTGFDAVNIGGKFDVTIHPGNPSSVVMTTDENILPYINTSVSQTTLNIGMQSNTSVSTSQAEKIFITSPTLHTITVGGKTTLHAANINTDHLAFTLNGKSIADLQGNIKNLQLNLNGKSELHVAVMHDDTIDLTMGGKGIVYLSGVVKNLNIISGGQATILAKNLIADNVTISGAGESNITVQALKTLSISTAGKSDIKYYGNPTINRNSFGASSLEKLSL